MVGSSPFKLYTWMLGSAAAGNMTASSTPASATLGGSATVNLAFTGLTPGIRYLGTIAYSGDSGMPSPNDRVRRSVMPR